MNIVKFVKQNASIILTVGSAASAVATAIFTARATVKAVRAVDYIEKEGQRPLTKRQIVEATWKYYIPAGLSLGSAITCGVLSTVKDQRRIAALGALYSMTEQARVAYAEKVIEKFGGEAHREIEKNLGEEYTQTHRFPQEDLDEGEFWVIEQITNQRFKSNYEDLRAIENDVNHELTRGPDISFSLNQLLDRLGLETSAMGNEVGWQPDKLLEFEFSTGFDKKRRPCILLGYKQLPFNGYLKWAY